MTEQQIMHLTYDILVYAFFGFIVWKMFQQIFKYGMSCGVQLAFRTDEAWTSLAESWKGVSKLSAQIEDPCNYFTDRDGNICFSMDDILPLIVRKLTAQGDLIMHKDGPQFIMVSAEKNGNGEVFLQLNVKDSNVKEMSPTKH